METRKQPVQRSNDLERDKTARLDVAMEAAIRAGEKTLEYFADPRLAVETKRDGSDVTIADRETERVLRNMIEQAFPDDAILGEEHDDRPGTSGWRWIIDPIDGTKSFVHGVPLYGTLVAVEDQRSGVMEIGVIHMPALGETVWAARGQGAWQQTQRVLPARVSQVAAVDQAMILATAWDYFAQENCLDAWLRVARQARATRGWSDCYAHVLVATGRADAVIEPQLHPWDIAPMLPIMAEAGGRCTDFAGRESAFTGNGIASNGLIHDALRAIVEDTSGAHR